MNSRYRAVLCPVAELTLLALHTAISIGATLAHIAAGNWDLAAVEHTAEQAAVHPIARAVEITGNPTPTPAIPTSTSLAFPHSASASTAAPTR